MSGFNEYESRGFMGLILRFFLVGLLVLLPFARSQGGKDTGRDRNNTRLEAVEHVGIRDWINSEFGENFSFSASAVVNGIRVVVFGVSIHKEQLEIVESLERARTQFQGETIWLEFRKDHVFTSIEGEGEANSEKASLMWKTIIG